jgi:hypothetical protein
VLENVAALSNGPLQNGNEGGDRIERMRPCVLRSEGLRVPGLGFRVQDAECG